MVKAVLFVDDDEDLREAMQDLLGILGVGRVVTAGSLQDLEARRDEALSCELALVDINLGRDEPNGVSVFEWLEQEGFAGRVIFLTGHAGKDPSVQRAVSLSGSDVASKPLSIAQLRQLIGIAEPT